MSLPFEMDVINVTNAPIAFPSKFNCQNGVQLLADKNNVGSIFIGGSNLSTTAKSFPLVAGAGAFIPIIGDLSLLYMVGDNATGKLWYYAS